MIETEEKITTLSQFFSRISEIRAKNNSSNTEEKNILLFRGHDDCCYKLKASIFREESIFHGHETQIYKETLHSYPNYFPKKNDIIDNLIQMQHYEIPTRLIDLTFSPLIALFFAVGGYNNSSRDKNKDINKNKINEPVDGEVLILECKPHSLAFSDDVNNMLMAGVNSEFGQPNIHCLLAPLFEISTFIRKNKNSKSIFMQEFKEIDKLVEDFSKKPHNSFELYNDIYAIEHEIIGLFGVYRFRAETGHLPSEEIELLKNAMTIYYTNTITVIRDFFKQYEINMPVPYIDELNEFVITPPPMLSPFFAFFFKRLIIKPRMNNDRIKNQQGAFLVQHYFNRDLNLKDDNILKSDDISIIRIIIAKDFKKQILTELEQNGITFNYLFPELDKFRSELERRIGTI
jgi:hypothetical protein